MQLLFSARETIATLVKYKCKTFITLTAALACAMLAIFYPKEKLQGHRLHELDQDIIEAITGMYISPQAGR